MCAAQCQKHVKLVSHTILLHVTHIKYPFSERQKTIELLQIIKISTTTLHVYGIGILYPFLYTRVVMLFHFVFRPLPTPSIFHRTKKQKAIFSPNADSFKIIFNINSFNKPVCMCLSMWKMIGKKNYHRNHIGTALTENAQFLYASAFIKQTCQHSICPERWVRRQGASEWMGMKGTGTKNYNFQTFIHTRVFSKSIFTSLVIESHFCR